MLKYTIYTKPNCPQCVQTKNLLESKGIVYRTVEIDVGQEIDANQPKIELSQLKIMFPMAKSAPVIVDLTSNDIMDYNQLLKKLRH